MSQAKERMYWWDFKSTAEDKAYLKGFEDALWWIHDEEALGWSEILMDELKELENESV